MKARSRKTARSVNGGIGQVFVCVCVCIVFPSVLDASLNFRYTVLYIQHVGASAWVWSQTGRRKEGHTRWIFFFFLVLGTFVFPFPSVVLACLQSFIQSVVLLDCSAALQCFIYCTRTVFIFVIVTKTERPTAGFSFSFFLHVDDVRGILRNLALFMAGTGRLLGKALFDGQLVQAHLVRPLYKHLLGWPIAFSDLEHVDHFTHESLIKMTELDDVEVSRTESWHDEVERGCAGWDNAESD